MFEMIRTNFSKPQVASHWRSTQSQRAAVTSGEAASTPRRLYSSAQRGRKSDSTVGG